MSGTNNFSSVKAIESLNYILENKNSDNNNNSVDSKLAELIKLLMSTIFSSIITIPISLRLINKNTPWNKVFLFCIIIAVIFSLTWIAINHIMQYVVDRHMKKYESTESKEFVKVANKFNSKIINELLVLSTLIRIYRQSEISDCVKKIYLAEILEDSSRITSYINQKIIQNNKSLVSINRDITMAENFISIYTFEAVYDELICISWFLYNEIIFKKSNNNKLTIGNTVIKISSNQSTLNKNNNSNDELFNFADLLVEESGAELTINLMLKDYINTVRNLRKIDTEINEFKKLLQET